jgi:polyisoprenyl-teichoic acid--peptidoglycan teichoic acid transferase
MERRSSLWTILGALVVLVVAGGTFVWVLRGDDSAPAPVAAPPSSKPVEVASSPAPRQESTIRGPLDLLLIGVDTRVSVPDWQPHADAIMLLHVEEDLRSGYLTSLPRDLRVDIPAFDKNGFSGGNYKLTEAMSHGAKVPGTDRANPAQGYQLLSRTISDYTGIEKFDAGAILTFAGLSRLTDALGGVTLTIDQKVLSKHKKPDGQNRTLKAGGGDYTGPQATYLPGTRKLAGWQAIDYARQRYTEGGDYTRQRHQRQLVTALITQALGAGLATDPAKLTTVMTALGDSLLLTEGTSAIEYAYALRDLSPSRVTLVGLPGDGAYSGGKYKGEKLLAEGDGYLKALAAGDPASYLEKHPRLVSKKQGG